MEQEIKKITTKVSRPKTYKREVAKILVGFLMYISLYGEPEVLKIIIWPFMLFVGAAYGMDWASKQTDYTITRDEEVEG